jgi:murein DD-endopeptidase MepM/ murein hydrolase activator NlpD
MIRYVVRSGDTLTSIARRFGTTVEAIMVANNLTDPNLIFVGQVLLIPVEAPAPAPTPPCPPCPPCPPTPPVPPPTPPPTPPTRPTVTRTFDGIQYTLSLNKGVYRMGEPVIIRLIKRNILSVPLTLTYRTSQKVDFQIRRDNVLIWQWSQNRVFTQVVTRDTFQPGEQKVYRVDWDQRTDSVLARPGTYRLTGWNLATPSIRLNLQFVISAAF